LSYDSYSHITFKALLESIPAEHRPSLDTRSKQDVETLMSGTMKSAGTTFIPLMLKNKDTGENIRVVLYAIVLPNLFMNMFIAGPSNASFVRISSLGHVEGQVFGFGFGDGDDDITYVRGI
jgi:hypothetical protein